MKNVWSPLGGFVITACSVASSSQVDDIASLATVPAPNAAISIVSAHSDRCLDVVAGSTADGAGLQQYRCLGPGQANQVWVLRPKANDGYTIVNENSGKCLDLTGGRTDNGVSLQQYTCIDGNPNQLWHLTPLGDHFQIRSDVSGKCVDVAGGSSHDGAQINVWDCHGGDNQSWVFADPAAHTTRASPTNLVSVNATKCLEIAGGNPNNGAQIDQFACLIEAQENQSFKLRPVSSDSYQVINVASGKCLDLPLGRTENGVLLQQFDCMSGNPNQFWRLLPRSNSAVSLQSVVSQKCVDVIGFSTADGTRIQQWDCIGADNQSWDLVDPTAPRPTPTKIGIFYGTTLAGNCNEASWFNAFQMNGARSLLFGGEFGACYDALDPETVVTHARYLHDLGIDFLSTDLTNLSKSWHPTDNPEVIGLSTIVEGLARYTAKDLKVVPMIAFTSAFPADHPPCTDLEGEGFTYNTYVVETIQAILDIYATHPQHFLRFNGKPVLQIYLSTGNSVKDCSGGPAFQGPYNLVPSAAQIEGWRADPRMSFYVQGRQQFLFDLAEIRWTLAASADVPNGDYAAIDPKIWPFALDHANRYDYAEAGHVALQQGFSTRSMDNFRAFLTNARTKPIVLVHNWNAFPVFGDEMRDHSTTLEPNTVLPLVDGSPGADPWYFFNEVKRELRALKRERGVVETYPEAPQKRPDLTQYRETITNIMFNPGMSDEFMDFVAFRNIGLSCLRIAEPSDPNGWDNNTLCYDTSDGLDLAWSFAGPIDGMYCTAFNDPSDPDTWFDNYLCANRDLELSFSNAGPLAEQYCIQLYEPADPHTWTDNYLCSPRQRASVRPSAF